jgi:hypothetical protein
MKIKQIVENHTVNEIGGRLASGIARGAGALARRFFAGKTINQDLLDRTLQDAIDAIEAVQKNVKPAAGVIADTPADIYWATTLLKKLDGFPEQQLKEALRSAGIEPNKVKRLALDLQAYHQNAGDPAFATSKEFAKMTDRAEEMADLAKKAVNAVEIDRVARIAFRLLLTAAIGALTGYASVTGYMNARQQP